MTTAVVIAASVMVTLTALAFVSGASCQHPMYVNVAVTDDLAPAVDRVAQFFNRQGHQVGGSCAEIEVIPNCGVPHGVIRRS